MSISRIGTRTRVALVALLAIAGACGPLHMGGNRSAMVIFTNESLDQADVYAAIAGADAVRLGTVLAARTDTLYVPSTVTSQSGTNIIARLLARNAQPRTGSIMLHPGDEIRVRLPSDGSTLFVTPNR